MTVKQFSSPIRPSPQERLVDLQRVIESSPPMPRRGQDFPTSSLLLSDLAVLSYCSLGQRVAQRGPTKNAQGQNPKPAPAVLFLCDNLINADRSCLLLVLVEVLRKPAVGAMRRAIQVDETPVCAAKAWTQAMNAEEPMQVKQAEQGPWNLERL